MSISKKERFEFGKNWRNFLKVLNEGRIQVAINSLKDSLNVESLEGLSFLDIGSGSGLFSLAAKRLGATVRSFDFDLNCIACTSELKERYYPNDDTWIVGQGDALDTDYLSILGKYDIVYSWGVLHHTGDMWKALENVKSLVKDNGKLFISLYNDQGWASKAWTYVKKTYNNLPKPLKFLVLIPCAFRLWGPTTIKDFIKLKPFHTWNTYKINRGMSPWVDVVDWVGGYPFEVSKPEQILDFYLKDNFNLIKLKTCAGGKGCNEYVFKKI